jgi:hypothetical protein
MSITYARFNDYAHARGAARRLARRVEPGEQVEVVRNPRRLSHHLIPLRMTAARVGAVLGGVVVGLLALLTLASGIWVLTQSGQAIPAPGETLALVVGLSALLGGLAGALAFASDNGAECQKVRRWLDEGNTVVFVDGPRGHEETLRHFGAKAVTKVR